MLANRDQESEQEDRIKGFIYKSRGLLRVVLPQMVFNVDPDGKP